MLSNIDKWFIRLPYSNCNFATAKQTKKQRAKFSGASAAGGCRFISRFGEPSYKKSTRFSHRPKQVHVLLGLPL